MRILALDTSSRVSTVAVLDGELLLAEDASPHHAQHGETLVPRLRAVMHTAGLGFDALNLIAVGIGPGSFTGLRVGLATAKGLALANGTPLRGVGSLVALARGALGRGASAVGGSPVAVCVTDAYRGEVFVAAYALEADGSLRVVLAPACVTPTAAAEYVHAGLEAHAPTSDVVLCGDGVAACRESFPRVLVGRGRAIAVGLAAPDARFVAAEARLAFEREGASDLATLEPFYLREAEVTLPTRS